MYQILSSKRIAAVADLATLAFGAAGASAAVTPLKCRQAIAKGAAKLEDVRVKSLQKCNDGLLNGKVPSCPDAKASGKISKAQTNLDADIAKNCAGLTLADMNFSGLSKQCGAGGYLPGTPCDVANDCPGKCLGGSKDGDPCFVDAFCTGGTCINPSVCDPADFCPSVQNDSRVEPFGLLPDSDCYFALSDPASVGACLSCVGEQTVGQIISDVYDTANPASADKSTLKCQRALGKLAVKHFSSVRKALAKCEAGVLKAGSGSCPDLKASDKITKSSAKLAAAITKACSDAQINSGFVVSQLVGVSGRPSAACASTDSSSTGLAAAIDCLSKATATASDALAVGSSPASSNPTCGNGKLDAGENCDDSNALQESGVGPADFCPADCSIALCTPSGVATASVNFASTVDLTALTVVLYYDESKVQVPGVNSDPPVQNAVLSSSFATTPVDTGYALRVVSIDPSLAGIPAGQAFTVTFDSCQGAPALTAGDLKCFVADATDAASAPVFGTSCSVTVP
ncbi:MAG: hypothetical protein ABI629_01800 [bacterium]